jgi:long-chain acyl-CoA synthetase
MEQGFWRIAEADPDRVALVTEAGESRTAGELLAVANQLVHGLRALGLEPGDQLAVIQPNGVEMVELYLAALQAGWRITPINHHLVGAEIAYIVNDSESKVLVGHERFADICIATAAELTGIPPERRFAVGVVDGFRPYSDLTDGQPTTTPDHRIAGMAMHYTSGTTGRPKGVKRGLVDIDPSDMGALMSGFQQMFGVTPGAGVHICGSPMYHTAPLLWCGSGFHMGHLVVLMDHWDPIRMMELIDQYHVTWSHMVPTQFHRILQAIPPERRGDYDVSSLQTMVHAAAPCPPDIKREMIAWWGDAILEYYAATEGGGTIITAAEWLEKPGSVGKPWPGSEVKILDDDHVEQPAGTEGTVYMSLALSDFEYKGDSAKTKENRWNGFFTVGDWGLLDSDGYLFLKDRKSDMIISGGVNIYPAEIEAALLGAPGVQDVAVFGIPHADWGEEIKAVVQLVPGTPDNQETRAAIFAHLEDKLAKFKRPKTIDVVEQLPRDPSGKLFKRKLRDPYWAGQDRKI